jgi:tetratricopeptide (TPR) repeat protein
LLQKNEALNNDDVFTKINAEYGRNYKNLGFYALALEYYQKAIDAAKNQQ